MRIVPAAEDVHPAVEHHEEHIGIQLREGERGKRKVVLVPPPEKAGESDDGHRSFKFFLEGQRRMSRSAHG